MYFPTSSLLILLPITSAAILPRQSAFLQQNQADALRETQSFANLCNGGQCNPAVQNICAAGGPAQCVNGRVVSLGNCPTGLTCMSLPLVNSRGTSKSTCTTVQNGAARMGISVQTLQNALGGNSGGGNAGDNSQQGQQGQQQNNRNGGAGNNNQQQQQQNRNQGTANNQQNQNQNSSQQQTGGNNFLQANQQQALAENRSFGRLRATDACDPNTQAVACIQGSFAQCVNGRLVVASACNNGLTCMSLPLLLRAGTSGASCTSIADGASRIGVSEATLRAALNGN